MNLSALHSHNRVCNEVSLSFFQTGLIEFLPNWLETSLEVVLLWPSN